MSMKSIELILKNFQFEIINFSAKKLNESNHVKINYEKKKITRKRFEMLGNWYLCASGALLCFE